MLVLLIDGSPLHIQASASDTILDMRSQIEQDLKIDELHEIKLFSGSVELVDSMSAHSFPIATGVINTSPSKALCIIKAFCNFSPRASDGGLFVQGTPSSSESDSDGSPPLASSDSSVDDRWIRAFSDRHGNSTMSLPSLPLSPGAVMCMRALDVIDDAQCLSHDPVVIVEVLLGLSLDLSAESSLWHLPYLPKWYELASRGLHVLTSHISAPGLANQVRTCLNSGLDCMGLHGLVRCSCLSKREAAAPFLSNVTHLLSAAHLYSAEARASLHRIASSCRVASTRIDAIYALASHTPSDLSSQAIRRNISHVARHDPNPAVRSAARCSLSGMIVSSEEEASSSSSGSW